MSGDAHVHIHAELRAVCTLRASSEEPLSSSLHVGSRMTIRLRNERYCIARIDQGPDEITPGYSGDVLMSVIGLKGDEEHLRASECFDICVADKSIGIGRVAQLIKVQEDVHACSL